MFSRDHDHAGGFGGTPPPARPGGDDDPWVSSGQHDWGPAGDSLHCLRPGCAVYVLDAGPECAWNPDLPWEPRW